jgi:hypothetical protein
MEGDRYEVRPMGSDGGPAFPVDCVGYSGMSLRDYFASKAMAATIEKAVQEAGYNGAIEAMTLVCKASYRIADAMLAARGN